MTFDYIAGVLIVLPKGSNGIIPKLINFMKETGIRPATNGGHIVEGSDYCEFFHIRDAIIINKWLVQHGFTENSK